jgi:hybrid cluster-associated redox disulfide protein
MYKMWCVSILAHITNPLFFFVPTVKKKRPPDKFLITEMSVQAILERWPQTAVIFNRYASACIGCAIAPFCTLSDVAKIYNLSLEAFTADLKKVIEDSKAEF